MCIHFSHCIFLILGHRRLEHQQDRRNHPGDKPQPPRSCGINTDCSTHRDNTPHKDSSSHRDSSSYKDSSSHTPLFSTVEPLQAHFEPLIHSMHAHRASIPGLTKGRMSNWRMKSVDSPRLVHRQGNSTPTVSQVETSTASDGGGICGSASSKDLGESGTTTSEMERTPLEVIMRMDPKQIVNILRQSTETHRKAMGTRHKCTPSIRWRHCTYHCVQILSARALTLMSHSHLVQHQIVNDGHIKTLVEALDPNHDPVSIQLYNNGFMSKPRISIMLNVQERQKAHRYSFSF